MNAHVARIFDDKECPLINALVYADGKLLVLESYRSSSGQHTLRTLCTSTIDSYFEHNPVSWVSSLCISVTAESECYQVWSGGGSMGGDGVVMVVDKTNAQPLWYFFLDNSDVFESAVFDSATDIVCRSTSGLTIAFPIPEPASMQVR